VKSKKERQGRGGCSGMWNIWETGPVDTGFWWGDRREKDYLEELEVE
jgi:hypothetical protein